MPRNDQNCSFAKVSLYGFSEGKKEINKMAFTLQPAVKDDFVDREDILADMITTLADESTRMGFALVGSRRIGKPLF